MSEFLTDYISEVVEEKVKEIALGDSEIIQQIKQEAEQDAKVSIYKRIIKNNGKAFKTDKERIPLQDLITSPEFSYYFPKVVTELALEAMEPELVLTGLLEQLKVEGPGLVIQMPVFGLTGQSLDVSEGQEYPELTVKFGGGIATITIGKAGVKVSITEETIKYSRYDVFAKAIEEATKALARWKEKKVVNMLLEYAKELQTGGTGVDVTGTANQGLSLDDIVNGILKLMEKGFNADMIIMHPLAYPIFAFNGTLRAFFYQTAGARGAFVQYPQTKGGQPADLEKTASLMPLNGSNIKTIDIPAGIIGKPMKVVLSPHLPFDSENKLTDIFIADSSNLGYLVTEQLPTTEEFRDPERDIRSLKITERYAVAPKYNGEAIGVIKDVKVVRTFDPAPFYSISPS